MKSLFIVILLAIPAIAQVAVPSKIPAAPVVATDSAAPAVTTDATAPAAPAPKLGPYELKNRSQFTLNREARAPFWPIGWTKSMATDPNVPRVTKGVLASKKKFEIQPQHFSVTSVLVGRPALATINGRSFAEGEVLPVIAGNERLRVVLKAVRDGGVWLEHGATQIYVPIRRAEVDTTRSTEQQPQSSEFSIQIGGQIEAPKEAPKEASKETPKP